MIHRVLLNALCLALTPMFSVAGVVKDQVHWESFLKRQDIVWEKLPQNFDHGVFLGNGLLGCMIYQDQPNRMRWELGRSDVTAHRRDNNRLPIGGLVLQTVGTIQGGTARLDLWNAEARGTVRTDKGTITFKTITHAIDLATVIEVKCTGEERKARFALCPARPLDFVNRLRKGTLIKHPEFAKDKDNPQPTIESRGPVMVCRQARDAGGEYVTAWEKVQVSEDTYRVVVTINDSYPEVNAADEAVATVRAVAKVDPDLLIKRHRQWWHQHYPKSFLSVPDPKVESFYWTQVYKMGCVTRADRMPIDLMGPWFRRSAWPRIWWNLNIQIAYLPFYTANHLDLSSSFTKMIDRNFANYQQNAVDLYGVHDGATVPHTTDYDGLRGDGSTSPAKFINPGDFTWALNNYYLQYRYTMDHGLVTERSTHRLFDGLKGCVNVYKSLLKEGEDGYWHLPALHSPEYGTFEDNNYNLALLRWACKALLELSERYGIEDSSNLMWKTILEKLVPYQVGETGILVGKDAPLMRSHRHWAHLMMTFPLYDEEWMSDKNSTILRQSIMRWMTITGGKGIMGWSHAGAATYYAFLRDGNMALKSLHNHHDDRRYVMPNTMYIEMSPVIECSLFAAKALHDMLLQSWGNTLRVFPAVPDAWQDTVFHDLRAEGAFLVSAKRDQGQTAWIRVKSLAGEPCRIETGWKGAVVVTKNGQNEVAHIAADGLLQLELKKDEEVLLTRQGMTPDMTVAPTPIKAEEANFWGNK